MTVAGLVIATKNPEKAAALERVSASLNVCPRIRESIAVEESGSTLRANAERKAQAASQHHPGLLAIASDGGLEIDALGDRWDPLRTARFAGSVSPSERVNAFLKLLDCVQGDQRSGRWVEACAVALGGCTLAAWTVRGRSRTIAQSPYEPLGAFWLESLLSPEGADDHWRALQELFDAWCSSEGLCQ